MTQGIPEDDVSNQVKPFRYSTFFIVLLGLILRFVAHFYLDDFFKSSPQFVTPANSFKRFKEGFFFHEAGLNPYDGDMFHLMPMFVYFIKPFINSSFALRLLWTFFDLLATYFIGKFVREYATTKIDDLNEVKRLQNLAVMGYLLNPMTIGLWTVLSFSTITNTLLAAFIFAMVKKNLPLSALFVVLVSYLNIYYINLLSAIFLNFPKRISTLLILLTAFYGVFSIVNLALTTESWKLIRNTVGFSLSVPDLSPNCGLFWYFFAQVFEHYQLLFLFAFQINAFMYTVPLAATLRQDVHLLTLSLLMLVAIFSSYPSYAETAIYLPLIFAFGNLHKYIRYMLVTGATIVTCIVLGSIMWRMWVITGTGNANFFFAIICVYNLTQTIIFCDVISAYLRSKMIRENGLENQEGNVDKINFVDPVLF